MAELTRRYVVMALATDAPFDPRDPDGAFVLKPWKDPAALRGLQAYRDHCYPEVARDLTGGLEVISEGTATRGDVGRRNEPYASAAEPITRSATPHTSRRARRGEARAGPKRKNRRRHGRG